MVYLIHFEEPYKGAQHYLGYTDAWQADERMEQHLNGTGSKLIKAVNEAGIEWIIVREWRYGDRTLERQLKNLKNAKKLCPFCNPDGWSAHGERAYHQCISRRSIHLQAKQERKPVLSHHKLQVAFTQGQQKTHILDRYGRPLCGCSFNQDWAVKTGKPFTLKGVAERQIMATCKRCEQSLNRLRITNNLK